LPFLSPYILSAAVFPYSRYDEAVEKLIKMCYIGIKRDTWEYMDQEEVRI
jgi:hypothetical protein